MTHWEFGHLQFDGDLANEKIVCQNCGWSWRVQDGGDDLFVCHKCGNDNTKHYVFNSNFEGADYSQAITQGVSAIGSIGSSVAQSKANKEAGKTDLQRQIDTICGKDKSKSWSKKKKTAYLDCKNRVINDVYSNKQKTSDVQRKSQELMLKVSAQKQKNQMYLVIGVVALILGIVVYKKMNK